MNTRIVSISKGYVAQVRKQTGTKGWLWWSKPVYEWLGIDSSGFTYENLYNQINHCVCRTKEEAEENIRRYKQVEEAHNAKLTDIILLTNQYDGPLPPEQQESRKTS